MLQLLSDVKIKTSTATSVHVAASAMVAISSVAMFFSLGMMAVAGFELYNLSETEPQKKYICTTLIPEPFGTRPDILKDKTVSRLTDGVGRNIFEKIKLYEKTSNKE